MFVMIVVTGDHGYCDCDGENDHLHWQLQEKCEKPGLVVWIVRIVVTLTGMVIVKKNHLHWQLEENCEKPEPGKLGHSLAKVAQVAKVQSDHLVHGDYLHCDGDYDGLDCDDNNSITMRRPQL